MEPEASALVIVIGPTAVGKSRAAVDLALRFGGEIVSGDSIQVYRGFDIGTDKPTPETRRGVPHHLIDVVGPEVQFTAADFVREALVAARGIAARGRLPIVAGGTGLYIKALCEGLCPGPGRGLKGARVVGISAPSRASTLFNYVGLDDGIIDYVCEIQGSLKIGKCMPGTEIPVVDEGRLFEDQPECAIIFSWHIADELAPKLRTKGFKGQLITPLTVPRFL